MVWAERVVGEFALRHVLVISLVGVPLQSLLFKFEFLNYEFGCSYWVEMRAICMVVLMWRILSFLVKRY